MSNEDNWTPGETLAHVQSEDIEDIMQTWGDLFWNGVFVSVPDVHMPTVWGFVRALDKSLSSVFTTSTEMMDDIGHATNNPILAMKAIALPSMFLQAVIAAAHATWEMGDQEQDIVNIPAVTAEDMNRESDDDG